MWICAEVRRWWGLNLASVNWINGPTQPCVNSPGLRWWCNDVVKVFLAHFWALKTNQSLCTSAALPITWSESSRTRVGHLWDVVVEGIGSEKVQLTSLQKCQQNFKGRFPTSQWVYATDADLRETQQMRKPNPFWDYIIPECPHTFLRSNGSSSAVRKKHTPKCYCNYYTHIKYHCVTHSQHLLNKTTPHTHAVNMLAG